MLQTIASFTLITVNPFTGTLHKNKAAIIYLLKIAISIVIN